MTDARLFRGFRSASEVILWTVRWYLQFPVSYRDLELMLADRGVEVDHTTIFRWIQAYAPEIEQRIRPHLRPSNGSTARRTLAGYEAMAMVRKGQVRNIDGRDMRAQASFIAELFQVAA